MAVQISVTGLSAAIRQLESYTKRIDKKMKTLCERLMNEGYVIAAEGFAYAYYAGTNDVEVDPPTWDGDTLVLRANGNAVAFIEFGTGTAYPEQYPDPSVYAKLGMDNRGNYGEGYGAHPPWYYRGDPGNAGRMKRMRDGSLSDTWVCSFGNPPAKAMFKAGLTITDKDHIAEIAREVFS